MNKIVITSLSAVALSAATLVYAGGACCAAKRGDAAANKAGQKETCGAFLSKLDLTAEQKTKIEALKQECQTSGCSAETHARFLEGLKGVLTAEQLAQWKADCEKAQACPVAKTAQK